MKEFLYSEPYYLAPNHTHQKIFLDGNEIGYLSTFSANFLDEIHETWYLPEGFEDENWIAFKQFSDYNEALNYAVENYDKLVYLVANGDWD